MSNVGLLFFLHKALKIGLSVSSNKDRFHKFCVLFSVEPDTAEGLAARVFGEGPVGADRGRYRNPAGADAASESLHQHDSGREESSM